MSNALEGPFSWGCIDRGKISPLRLLAFAAALPEPCKYQKTPVEMTRDLAYLQSLRHKNSLCTSATISLGHRFIQFSNPIDDRA